MADFYIYSKKWTRRGDPCVTFWRPNDAGYCWSVNLAGRYPEGRVKANSRYYNNGDSTRAVPCEVVDRMLVDVPDRGDPRVTYRGVPNTAENRRAIVRAALPRRLPSEVTPT